MVTQRATAADREGRIPAVAYSIVATVSPLQGRQEEG